MRRVSLLLICAFFLAACGTPSATLPAASPQPSGSAVALLAANLAEPRESWLFHFPFSSGEFSAVGLPTQALPYIAQWSPDGLRMAVVLLLASGEVDLYLYDAAAKTFDKLTNTPQCTEVGLAWSADSQVLRYAALCRSPGSPTELFSLTLSSRTIEPLGIIPLQALYVAWNPGQDLLALAYPQTVASGERKVTIYIETGAGLGSETITAPVSAVADAAEGASGLLATVMDWSPDGQHLAYVSKLTDGVTYLLSLPARGGDVQVIRALPGECLFPRWSPDASQLSLVCGTDIYLVSADGSRQTLLVDSPDGWFASFPAWSPDGQTLAFLVAPVDNPAVRRLDTVSLLNQSYSSLGEVLGGWQAGVFWKPAGALATTLQPTPGASSALPLATIPLPILWGWGIVLLVIAFAVTFRRLRRSGFDPFGDLGNWKPVARLRAVRPAARPQPQVVEIQPAAPMDSEDEAEDEDEFEPLTPVVAVDESPAPVPAPPARKADPQLLANAVNLIRSGAYDQGIRILRQYLAVEDTNPMAWLWLGNACAQRGDYRTAQRCFLRAEKLGSASARAALAWLDSKQRPGGS